MKYKTRLELTWIGKENRPRLEPRVLVEGNFSYHAPSRISENDIFDNVLIQGDNLLGLKALEQEYAGRVKCVYIDPPYNTGSAFEHYDDGVEHSLWLSLIRDRIELIRTLLSEEGTLWITIDDNEAHYLKVLCDEIFGRVNFVTSVAWMKRVSPANDARYFSSDHDNILVYCKNKDLWKPNRLERTEDQNAIYKNPDNDPRGNWNSITYTGNKTRVERPNLYYPITNPYSGEKVWPPDNLTWRYGTDTHMRNEDEGLLYWGKDGKSRTPRLKMFLSNAEPIVPRSVWMYSEYGSTQSAMTEQKSLSSVPFSTPKPEQLLSKIIHIATNPGDLVLDSFAGSGTTGAVAHKMGRRWIMIEIGEHAHTHIVPRLRKVIDGEDKGGVTEATGWQGGGGFRYYTLAPSLLKQDRWGQWIINDAFKPGAPKYKPEMLVQAVCKIEGFRYEPSDTVYWQQGRSTETDFLYVTTQTLTHEQLQALSEEVGEGRSLLVLCGAFEGNTDTFPNLTMRKIPKTVLHKCEWGHDDYSLKVENLPKAPPSASSATAPRRTAPTPPATASLFDGEDTTASATPPE